MENVCVRNNSKAIVPVLVLIIFLWSFWFYITNRSADTRRLTIGRYWLIQKNLFSCLILSYLFRLRLLSEDSYLLKGPGLPLTGIQAYYMPENLTKTPKIRWPGVQVCPK